MKKFEIYVIINKKEEVKVKMKYEHDTGMLIFDRDDETYSTKCLRGVTYANAIGHAYDATTSALNCCTSSTAATLSVDGAINSAYAVADKVNTIAYTLDNKLSAATCSLQEELNKLKKAMSGGSGLMRKGPVSRTLIFDSVEDFERVYQC